jgi:hypothetical protein
MLAYNSVQNLLSLLSKNVNIRIYKTIILPLVLYECKALSLLREEHRLTVYEKNVLRGIFGRNTAEARGGWKKLHSE